MSWSICTSERMHTDEKSRCCLGPVNSDEAAYGLPQSVRLRTLVSCVAPVVSVSPLHLQQHHVLLAAQELQEEAEIQHRDKRKALVKLQKVLPPCTLLAVTWTRLCGMSTKGPAYVNEVRVYACSSCELPGSLPVCLCAVLGALQDPSVIGPRKREGQQECEPHKHKPRPSLSDTCWGLQPCRRGSGGAALHAMRHCACIACQVSALTARVLTCAGGARSRVWRWRRWRRRWSAAAAARRRAARRRACVPCDI